MTAHNAADGADAHADKTARAKGAGRVDGRLDESPRCGFVLRLGLGPIPASQFYGFCAVGCPCRVEVRPPCAQDQCHCQLVIAMPNKAGVRAKRTELVI